MSDILLALIPVAFIAGFITSIAGGGGVIFVTTALALGMPSLNVLALNRITDLGVISGSLNNYRKVPEISWRSIKIFTPLFLIGAIGGAMFAVSIPDQLLKIILVTASILAITLIILQPRPKFSTERKLFCLGYIAIFLIGFWDGAIAMAGGTFFLIACHYFFGMDYMKARAVNIFTVIPETIVSAAILVFHSTITLTMGLTLYASATVGAYIGSKIAIKKGHEFIRYGMIGVSILMIAKLVIYDMILKS